MCSWGEDNVAFWANETGNSWRTTGDISDNFASMVKNIEENDASAASAGPGGWNDVIMMQYLQYINT
jgi:alpha-galactosidase